MEDIFLANNSHDANLAFAADNKFHSSINANSAKTTIYICTRTNKYFFGRVMIGMKEYKTFNCEPNYLYVALTLIGITVKNINGCFSFYSTNKIGSHHCKIDLCDKDIDFGEYEQMLKKIKSSHVIEHIYGKNLHGYINLCPREAD